MSPLSSRYARAAFLLSVVVLSPAVAQACKTPVYRYALYKWQPSNYRVYYVYSAGEIPAADAKTIAAITKTREAKPSANVDLHVVRVDDPESLDKLDAAARNEAAEIIADVPPEKLPQYVIVDPYGGQLHAGPLAADDIPVLVDSPTRRRTNQLIAQGHAAVLVLLTGKDAEANARAEKEIESIIKAVADGKIESPKLPGDDPSAAEPDPVTPPPLKIASLKLNRDEPGERCFVRCLMHVEDDLADIDEPMVFAVYGQCRANPPLVGKGIDAEQLTNQVKFVLGPCSCTIKEQNVGLDLLATYDWQEVALSLAKRVGPETGNEHLLGADAFPNLFPKLHDAPPLDSATASTDSAPSTSPTVQIIPSDQQSPELATDSAQGHRVLGLSVLALIVLLAAATLFLIRNPRD